MPIEYVNRRKKTYYLHEGRTKTGKPKFYFSMKRAGMLAAAIPAGFEVYENPDALVTLRKVRPRLVTDAEVATIDRGIRALANAPHFLLDVQGNAIVVHVAEGKHLEEGGFFSRYGVSPRSLPADVVQSLLNYAPMMRFTLADEETRQFGLERWCFRGSIDGWITLDFGDLSSLVTRYCPHLGRESFYDLM